MPDTLNVPEWDNAVEISSKHPVLEEYDLQSQILSQEKNIVDKEKMPNLGIGADYIVTGRRSVDNLEDNGKNAMILPRVMFSVPLYNKKYRVMKEVIDLQIEETAYRKESGKDRLEVILASAAKEFDTSQKEFKLMNGQIKLAEKALDILIQEYSSGKRDFNEVLDMERRLLQFKVMEVTALADMNSSAAMANYAMGKTVIQWKMED